MKIRRFADENGLGRAAAEHAAMAIRQAIGEKGTARILVETGASQRVFLAALAQQPDVRWGDVDLFQVCEYLGVPADDPASIRSGLFDQFIHKTRIGRYHLLDGQHDPERTCRDEGQQLAAGAIDVAMLGVGDNGRLAFNGAPADFGTEKPYLIVRIDDSCRPLGVDAARALADSPQHAITISIRQLLKAKAIVCVVPGARKADAVKRCVEGAISPLAPASILRTHPDVTLYLDTRSAALLSEDA